MAKIYLLLALFLISSNPNSGYAQESDDVDFSGFSLEELLDVEVVSLSRKAESIQGAAAAIFVISADDIRRSGVHSIPEALRLAPGINVARINSSSWAVTSRGFNSRFANKLQVLVDGRSVYSPMFSGVYWEESSVMIEDIERIEIIRGPGATMWGSNAVNGVINIITAKPEADKLDSFATAMAGTRGYFRGAGRLDGALGKSTLWRLSAQGKAHGNTAMASGEDSRDAWDEQLVRLRMDHKLADNDVLFLAGHFFNSDMESDYLNNTTAPPYSEISQGNVSFKTASLQASWERTVSATAGIKMGLYYTHFERNEHLIDDKHQLIEADFQNNFNATSRHSVVWGLGWRYYQDDLQGQPSILFNPANISGRLYSAFAQDDWSVLSDRLNFILGSKWEYRQATGSQWQPSARVAWTPSEKATWWGSAARALRTPSRINRHVQMDMTILPPGSMGPGSPTTSVSMVGNPQMEPEELLAYETGFHFRPTGTLSFDLAFFINEYDKLRILVAGIPGPHPTYGPSVIMVPLVVNNGTGGRTQGGELSSHWIAAQACQFKLAYCYWDYKVNGNSAGLDDGMERLATPKHQISLRGLFNPLANWEADVWFRFTDDLLADKNNVEAWHELDLRLSWAPISGLNISLGGQNLLSENHQEFIYSSASPNPAYIPRSGYVEMRWNF